MPKGNKMRDGEEFWLLRCPCMNGDSKRFKDEKTFKMYNKLHSKKCEIGRHAYTMNGTEASNLILGNTLTTDNQLRRTALDTHARLFN